MPKDAEIQIQSTVQQQEGITIAVLPFVNMSGKDDFEYFSDGITEEIINALAKVDSLKVTSRTSSFYFKNVNKPVKKIAEKLSVSVILEGSVRLSVDTVRITAQLIQPENDYHFWSETWDRKLENIFEVQDEISVQIAEKLREHFGHFEIQEHLVRKKTENLDAYDYSLKARYHYNKWNREDAYKAIELNEKAIEIDSNHVDALVGLADTYSFFAATELMPPVQAWQKVKEYTEKANAIDDSNPWVYYQFANLAFFTESNFQLAFKHSLKALEICPNFTEAHQFTSFLYVISGQVEKAKEHIELALNINPLSQETLFYKAYFLYRTQNYKDALPVLDSCLSTNPLNVPALILKSYCFIKLQQYDKALDYLNNAPPDILPPDEKLGITGIANIHKDGSSKNANYFFSKLQETAKNETSFQAHSYLYLAYAGMGNTNEAFKWLDKIITLRTPIILLTFADPLANSLKKDKHYLEYHEKLFPLSNKVVQQKQSKAALFDTTEANVHTEKLLQFINEEEPFLIPNLSLQTLAEQIQIHPNKLSWLLNEQIGKNFNEFINHYRIEYFKTLAQNPDNSHISLLGLAYESGFNSKSVFNTYFKKETGKTPKEYLNQVE